MTTDSLPLFAQPSEPFDVKDAALAIRARLVPVAQETIEQLTAPEIR